MDSSFLLLEIVWAISDIKCVIVPTCENVSPINSAEISYTRYLFVHKNELTDKVDYLVYFFKTIQTLKYISELDSFV